MRLIPVPVGEIDGFWKAAEKHLRPAVEGFSDGCWQIEDVYTFLKSRDMQLWTAFDDREMVAAAVTQIICYPRKKLCAVHFVGGIGRNNWLQFQEVIGAWAKAQGCAAMETSARKGWLRVLTNWRPVWTQLRRDLI